MVRVYRSRLRVIESLEGRHLLSFTPNSLAVEPCRIEDTGTSFTLAAQQAESTTSLNLSVARQILPGIPFLVRADVVDADGRIDRSVWDAAVTLTTDSPNVELSVGEFPLVNGRGSALVMVDTASPFQLSVHALGMTSEVTVTPLLDVPPQAVSGRLTGDTSVWTGVIRVTDDVIVPAGHTLTIEEGTIVLVDGLPESSAEQFATSIHVLGTVDALGTASAPIQITATDPDRPWGEISVNGGQVNLQQVMLSRAGNSRRGGHTNTGPALRMSNDAALSLSESSITDIAGKILQSTSGQLTIVDSLMTRAVMGPEINNTSLEFRDSWIVEMAGRYHYDRIVDDNDGIYLHSQVAGQSIELIDSVVAGVQDDGIDTLGSNVVVSGTIIRDITDKGISVFNGSTTVRSSLIVQAAIGIETKGSGAATPTTQVLNSTIANVDRAIRARNNRAPDVVIAYTVHNSILHVRPGGDALHTDYDPIDMNVNYTWSNETWNHAGSGLGNLVGDPVLADFENNDYRLLPGSPAIDAGDPSTQLDPDGTRADLGYLPRLATRNPDFNRDDTIDARDIDLLCVAVHTPFDGRFDLTGDRVVDADDVRALLQDVLGTGRGDANLDGQFNSDDLLDVFAAGKYEDGIANNAGWAEGDWNCDGDFTSDDLLAAFADGGYDSP